MLNKLNISIDDISPHPMSSISVVDRCFEIIEIFPKAKFKLFVPVSYWRTQERHHNNTAVATKTPLQINLFTDFCQRLRDLPSENFEIGYHGFYHGIPGKSDNDEMRYLS